MLPRSLRLPIHEASIVRRTGKRFTNGVIQLQFLVDTGSANTRWLIQAPKRSIPLSTDRNRARRIIGEAIVALSKQVTVGGNGIITVRKPLSELQPADILAQLQPLYIQAGILKV